MAKKEKLLALKLNPKKHDGWLKIGVEGSWEGHFAGSFELSERDFKNMLMNAEELGIDIVVDYEHATIYNPDKAPAAGWITTDPIALKVEDGELYCKIDWTPVAKDHISNKEYRYLSPVFRPNTTDRKSGNNIGWTLHSVALTNTPFLTELEAIANKQHQHKEDNNMSKELQDKLDAANKQLTKKDDEIKTLKEQLKTAKDENKEHEKIACTAKVDAAIAAGQIGEDQKDWAVNYALSDKDGFETFLKGQKPSGGNNPGEGSMFDNKDHGAASAAPQIDMSKV